MFRSTVRAICETVAPEADPRVPAFVLSCFPAMPRWLAVGLRAFTLAFGLAGLRYGGRPFFANPPAARLQQWRRWRAHRLGACRDLVRFYESLATLAQYSPAGERAE